MEYTNIHDDILKLAKNDIIGEHDLKSKIISKLKLEPRIIKLILIRHAEGYHNKAAEQCGEDEYKNYT